MKEGIENGGMGMASYRQKCEEYLTEALREEQPEEELEIKKRILSNPMDLTIVAQMIQNAQYPDLSHLQEQQYNLMAQDYKTINLEDFPLTPFSEMVYQMRLDNQATIPTDTFYPALKCMEDYKMVLCQQSTDADNKPTQDWKFRHDKIMEFFIVQTFLGRDNYRQIEHIDDPRFRGVYFLLATLLPLDEARNLREELIQYAAETNDNTVSNEYVRLMRYRK